MVYFPQQQSRRYYSKNELNFTKQKSYTGLSRQSREDQYIADNHSLIPFLSLFRHPANAQKISYVLTEPRTRNLIGIDLIDSHHQESLRIVSEIEKQSKSELRYLLQTNLTQENKEEFRNIWQQQRPKLKLISSTQDSQADESQIGTWLGDLQTFELGELCICLLETPGQRKETVSYVVTHVTPESTKIPFLFSGETLLISGCAQPQNGLAESLFYSLQKLINLPNDTLLFPSGDSSIENLQFAKYVDPENPMIDQKLQQVQQLVKEGLFSVPSKLVEERLYNPFLRCAREEHFREITGEQDPVRAFAKLRKLRDTFKIK